MFRPRRLWTRKSSSVETSARKPSHLSSKDHPEPEGRRPGRDSIGSGSRRAATLARRPSPRRRCDARLLAPNTVLVDDRAHILGDESAALRVLHEPSRPQQGVARRLNGLLNRLDDVAQVGDCSRSSSTGDRTSETLARLGVTSVVRVAA
jgi:hypothetical protein